MNAHAYRVEHDYGRAFYVELTNRAAGTVRVGPDFTYNDMPAAAAWDLAYGWACRLAAITGGDVETMIVRP